MLFPNGFGNLASKPELAFRPASPADFLGCDDDLGEFVLPGMNIEANRRSRLWNGALQMLSENSKW
jgi:hypothetical protein